MLYIKTTIRKSKSGGLGLFAGENISKGETIWMFNPVIDVDLTEDDIQGLPTIIRDRMYDNVFFDKHNKVYILCGDDSRFLNHDDVPNCEPLEREGLIANRDIDRGEELTIHYKHFYIGEMINNRNQE